jgi:hypothetical protein
MKAHAYKHVCHATRNVRVPCYKATVKIGKPKKHLDLSKGLWCRPFGYSIYLCRVRLNSFGCDNEPKEFDLINTGFGFGSFSIELVLAQPL